MSGLPPLPKLIRYDLNADGSVTLLLEHSGPDDLNIVTFAAGETMHPYRVRRITTTLGYDDETEALVLDLFHPMTGITWKLTAPTHDALEATTAIHSHLKAHRPKPDAAVLFPYPQKAAYFAGVEASV